MDCGLFQGSEIPATGGASVAQFIDFDLSGVRALLVTHCHIDHVGRIPQLLAAGFKGPIYCSQPTALLLPLVLEDAVKIGLTRDAKLLEKFGKLLRQRIQPVPYNQWLSVPAVTGESTLAIRFQRAGHILGSAYIECKIDKPPEADKDTIIVFSGDLGAKDTPLLPEPRSPERADILVLESTYGNRVHDDRKLRTARLKTIVEHCFENRGVVLVPAFSIGRTQELLYELEQIVYEAGEQVAAKGMEWQDVEIIVDSPMAAKFTSAYRQLKTFWDAEAKEVIDQGRHPLAFDQVTTVGSHREHLRTVDYLRKTARPSIVIAASGMCAGGRIMNYLKALIDDPRTDILFAGYQAAGTPGRDIQTYGPNGGWVKLNGQRHDIKAGTYTLSGYSAHADQQGLSDFVTGIPEPPRQIRLVHGNDAAKRSLMKKLQLRLSGTEIIEDHPSSPV